MMSNILRLFCIEMCTPDGRGGKGRECKFQNKAHRTFDILNYYITVIVRNEKSLNTLAFSVATMLIKSQLSSKVPLRLDRPLCLQSKKLKRQQQQHLLRREREKERERESGKGFENGDVDKGGITRKWSFSEEFVG